MRKKYEVCRWLAAYLVVTGCLLGLTTGSASAQEPKVIDESAVQPEAACPPGGIRSGWQMKHHAHISDDGVCKPYPYGNPDLFYNYYVNPQCSGLGASLYLSPGPVPAHVGHTYITYQPLQPHEFMYPHHRTYHRHYDDGRGVTRTSVHWYKPPFKGTASHVHHMLKIPR